MGEGEPRGDVAALFAMGEGEGATADPYERKKGSHERGEEGATTCESNTDPLSPIGDSPVW